MEQFTPDVSEADVERVLQREVPPEEQEAIRAMIARLECRERDRVVLACLKNARGDVQSLKHHLTDADGWYREEIGEAEYPHYTKKMFRIDTLSREELESIFERDKAQYLTWLHGEK